MCGINGYINGDKDLIHRMNESNQFRGPDYTDVWQDRFVSLGHNLLAINGTVENSIQPRVSRKGNILVYNGEIYGTDTLDTDYLCDVLDYHGVDYLKNVNGQFALAWYDVNKKQLTICRDHFGGKPLFYVETDNGVVFSSTLHAINLCFDLQINKRVINRIQGMDRFYTSDMTLYHNVSKLVPGEYITYDAETGKRVSSGSLHDYQLGNEEFSDRQVKRLISECLTESIRNPNRTAVMLSGGLDSNTILHHCVETLDDVVAVSCKYTDQKGVEERYVVDSENTTECAKFFSVPHHVSLISPEHMYEYKQEILQALYMPAFDLFRLSPRFFAVKKAAEAGAKVVLSGDGGDEIFTGYSGDRVYLEPGARQLIENTIATYKEMFPNLPLHVLGGDYINNHRFLMMVSRDTFSFVNDGFAGFHSVEQRFPFYHQRLVKTMLSIPGELKLRGTGFTNRPPNTDKYYLRKLYQYELPFNVTHSSIKAGFAAPWDSRDEIKNRRVFAKLVEDMRSIIN